MTAKGMSFSERHRRYVGRISNEADRDDKTKRYASVYVCDRKGCQDRARFYIKTTTGGEPLFSPFAHLGG